jgi:agmatinase
MDNDQPISHFYVGIATFGQLPLCDDIDDLRADVAILGIPFENTMGVNGTRLGPRGIREESIGHKLQLTKGFFSPDDEEYYFGPSWKIVDCGDVPIVGSDVEPSFTYIRDYVRKITAKGAILVSLGGDHAITAPILEALDDQGPFAVIHIDAHMDWADYPGRPYCHSKPMRRASEMAHIVGMAQLGIRAFRVTSHDSYKDAVNYGSVICSPRKMRELGTEAVIAKIPQCERYYVSIDIDAMDPSIAPATGAPDQGGLLYYETRELLKGIAGLGEIIAFDLVEVAPHFDPPRKPTCILAATLICDFLGFVLKEKEHRGVGPKEY